MKSKHPVITKADKKRYAQEYAQEIASELRQDAQYEADKGRNTSAFNTLDKALLVESLFGLPTQKL